MLIEASQTEEHRNHHSVLCMRHSVRNILVAGVKVWSMWRNAFKTWWSELHKSINLHITRTATVTLWELVSWTEFYGLQCSSFSVDRTLQLSIKLQSAAACLHRGGSPHEAGAVKLWAGVARSWPGVWRGLGALEMEHSEQWRNLLPLLPPHYVEHNKASLIFKLVRHKCFLLHISTVCVEARRTSPTVTHHEKPWEEEGLCTFRFHVILFVQRLPSELLISGQTDDDYVYGNAVEEEDERTKILFTNIYLAIFSLIRLVNSQQEPEKLVIQCVATCWLVQVLPLCSVTSQNCVIFDDSWT